MRFASLFSGIGGFDLGLERAGHQCVYQCEIDDFCVEVLWRHWPNVQRERDIRRVHKIGPAFDALIGGDPCQSHSNACRNAEPTQKSLAEEFLRVVEINRPRFVVRENPAVVRRDIRYDWRGFSEGLETLGYYTLPIEAAACCAGAEHIRKRLFVFAAFQDADIEGLERYECQVLAGKAKNASVSESIDLARSARWDSTSRVCRAADGIPFWVDRLRTLGNAVSPVQGEWVGKVLTKLDRQKSITSLLGKMAVGMKPEEA